MIPDFKIEYEPDFRQAIADSWPRSLDDTESINDWGLKDEKDVTKIAVKIMKGIEEKYKEGVFIKY